jgi:phosphoglycerate dehydrogenase-like enzyme
MLIGITLDVTDVQQDRLRAICGTTPTLIDLRRGAYATDPRAADVEIVYGAVKVDAVKFLPRLHWLHSAWTGVDGLLHEALRTRNVIVTNTRGVNAYAMAEHVLAAIFYLARDFSVYEETNPHGVWRPTINPVRVAGSCALLLGTGALAALVAARLRLLDVRVRGFNSSGHPVPFCEAVYTRANVEPYLSVVDWLVVLLPGTPLTANLVDAAFLAALKPGVGVVNVGRGVVIDHPALLAAIDRGHVRGAVLDVTHPEPLPADSPLFSHPRVLVTSHQSWIPSGGVQDGFDIFLENLRHYLTGRHDNMRNRVSFDHGY